MNAEQARLEEARSQQVAWRKWGPYLSERQWGTVREDYSERGDAWNYFTHDQARSRAYRWGEDGLAGISDDKQRLCFAIALWNGQDPILKERLFGLTNSEGNHGEDVKEYYFYLDCTPTHSYMKYLYKYPQAAFPYADVVETSRSRGREDFEYELLDTGVFDENRYFDVLVEYAKGSPEDILIQITAHNRGPEAAELHVLPTLWFRNQWSWQGATDRPGIQQTRNGKYSVAQAVAPELGTRYTVLCRRSAALLFTENETNTRREYSASPIARPTSRTASTTALFWDKRGRESPADRDQGRGPLSADGRGRQECRDPAPTDRIAPADFPKSNGRAARPFGGKFDDVFRERRDEADEFYNAISPASLSADERNVMRQALAGMLWSKQFYFYDVDKWLEERGSDPFKAVR